MLNSHLTNYNTNIKMIKKMNSRIFSKEFRSKEKIALQKNGFLAALFRHVGLNLTQEKNWVIIKSMISIILR